MIRMRESLTDEEMKLAFAFLLTMPGCPFIYYGDEIGMRYVHGLKSKEGGYDRTGSRTPMQWNQSANAGFSTAGSEALYLPIDPDPARPDADGQTADPDSLLSHVKGLISFRSRHESLQAGADFRFLTDGAGCPLVYERKKGREMLLVAINPSAEEAAYRLPEACGDVKVLMAYHGAFVDAGNRLVLPAGSYIIAS